MRVQRFSQRCAFQNQMPGVASAFRSAVGAARLLRCRSTVRMLERTCAALYHTDFLDFQAQPPSHGRKTLASSQNRTYYLSHPRPPPQRKEFTGPRAAAPHRFGASPRRRRIGPARDGRRSTPRRRRRGGRALGREARPLRRADRVLRRDDQRRVVIAGPPAVPSPGACAWPKPAPAPPQRCARPCPGV